MEKNSKIYIAGHNGMVGSAIRRNLEQKGYVNLVFSERDRYDLTNQSQVAEFFSKEKPDYVFLAAAKVGGIGANNKYRAQFIYENLMIQNNIIHQSYVNGVKKLLFLGSSCIYPKNAPQPLKEEYLLTDELEYTNEPYAIAKIAGIKMCESYNIQYGTNFISVMPTNLYGPNDNYDLETSHVLPAMMRKMHLAKCIENNDWESIRKDLKRYPVEGVNENSDEKEILKKLSKYGIQLEPQNPEPETLNTKTETRNTKHVTLTLWGTGTPYREFLHVDDLADACVYLMKKVDFKDVKGSSAETKNTHINIGTGQDMTIRDLAYLIKDTIGFRGEIMWDDTKPDGTFRKLLDVSKLCNLDWSCNITLVNGVESVYFIY
jgi:GDP-L-fucose synthase